MLVNVYNTMVIICEAFLDNNKNMSDFYDFYIEGENGSFNVYGFNTHFEIKGNEGYGRPLVYHINDIDQKEWAYTSDFIRAIFKL